MNLESNTPVPAFNVSAADLLDTIDSITDCAAQGVEKAKQAISAMPAEAQPILNELMAHFRAIGHAADATVAGSGTGTDLAKVWGIDAVAA